MSQPSQSLAFVKLLKQIRQEVEGEPPSGFRPMSLRSLLGKNEYARKIIKEAADAEAQPETGSGS